MNLRGLISPLALLSLISVANADGRVDRLGDPLPEHAVQRLGTVRFRPASGSPHVLTWSPDGKRIATASAGFIGAMRTGVQVWDVESGREIGPQGLIGPDTNDVAWAPDGRRLAVCASTKNEEKHRIEIWNVVTQRRERSFATADSPYDSVAWSADGQHIAYGRKEGNVAIATAVDGRLHAKIDAPASALAFDAKGATLFAAAAGRLTEYDIEEKRVARRWKGGWDRTYDIDVTADGRYVAFSSGDAHLIDRQDESNGVTELTESKGAFSVHFTRDGKHLATGGFTDEGRILSVPEGAMETRFRSHSMEFAIAFSPDGTRLAVGGRSIRFIHPQTGIENERFDGHTANILQAIVTPDGRHVVSTSSDATARVWELETGQLVHRVQAAEGRIGHAAALARDGRTVASPFIRDRDGAAGILTWDVQTGRTNSSRIVVKNVERDGSLVSLAYSPTEDLLVAATSQGLVLVNDEIKWRPAKPENDDADDDSANPFSLCRLRYSPDGKWLTNTFMIHSIVGRIRTRDWTPHPGPRMKALFAAPVAFSPDGSRIAVRGLEADIELFDATTLESLQRTESSDDDVIALAWSPDGALLATSVVDPEYYGHHWIRIWSARTLEPLGKFEAHPDRIADLAFTPDGTRLISASQDTTLLVWDMTEFRKRLADDEKD